MKLRGALGAKERIKFTGSIQPGVELDVGTFGERLHPIGNNDSDGKR